MADNSSRAGERYVDADIIEFLNQTHTPLDPGLRQAFDAPAKEGIPAIQISPAEGRTVQLFMRMIGAKKVVELGTLAAFSTIHLARGLAVEGHVWTVEFEPKHAEIARHNIQTAGLSDRITVVEGAGLDVLPTLEEKGPFDAVFIDADKGNYDKYAVWAAKNTRPGGLLLVDNAYYFGKLMTDTPAAAAVRRMHQAVGDHFDAVCLPTPDGLLLGIRR